MKHLLTLAAFGLALFLRAQDVYEAAPGYDEYINQVARLDAENLTKVVAYDFSAPRIIRTRINPNSVPFGTPQYPNYWQTVDEYTLSGSGLDTIRFDQLEGSPGGYRGIAIVMDQNYQTLFIVTLFENAHTVGHLQINAPDLFEYYGVANTPPYALPNGASVTYDPEIATIYDPNDSETYMNRMVVEMWRTDGSYYVPFTYELPTISPGEFIQPTFQLPDPVAGEYCLEWRIEVYHVSTTPFWNGWRTMWSEQSCGYLGDISTGIESEVVTGFAPYPNPFEDIVTVTSDEVTSYEVFDLTGKVADSGVLQTGPNPLSLSHLPSGMYILKVGEVSQKLVKH